MKVLIVYAHPEPDSFNGALKNRAVHTLESLGHDVQVSDLNQIRWKAALDQTDFAGPRLNEARLDVSAEQEHMMASYGPGADVLTEQQKVVWCDLMIFQFPIWWFGMPAILKGWVDRVMVRGFAYAKGRKYDTGMFRGRRAMICTSTGTAASLYEPDGIDGDIMHILWPIHNGVFRYLGFDVLPPYVAWMPGAISQAERQASLDLYASRLRTLDKTELLYFHPREDYGDDQRLKPGVIARSGFQWNPQAGQSHEEAARTFTRRHDPRS